MMTNQKLVDSMALAFMAEIKRLKEKNENLAKENEMLRKKIQLIEGEG
jgi:FtsZ-binding cell division protein ZapB